MTTRTEDDIKTKGGEVVAQTSESYHVVRSDVRKCVCATATGQAAGSGVRVGCKGGSQGECAKRAHVRSVWEKEQNLNQNRTEQNRTEEKMTVCD